VGQTAAIRPVAGIVSVPRRALGSFPRVIFEVTFPNGETCFSAPKGIRFISTLTQNRSRNSLFL